MGKLCPRGKAAAKRKFKVYPSAYANAYAVKVCKGQVKSGGKKITSPGYTKKKRRGAYVDGSKRNGLTPKLVSPVADRKVRSVKATQLADHLDVSPQKHPRLRVKCQAARRPSSTELRQVVDV